MKIIEIKCIDCGKILLEGDLDEVNKSNESKCQFLNEYINIQGNQDLEYNWHCTVCIAYNFNLEELEELFGV